MKLIESWKKQLQRYHYYCLMPVCEEMSKLFAEIWRELLSKKLWQNDDSFIQSLWDECYETVLCKFDFLDEKHARRNQEPGSIFSMNDKSSVVQSLTPEEERDLYKQSPNLWMARYACLVHNFSKNKATAFYEGILELAILNNSRVVVERKIYFQAYQFLAGQHREYSLMCYLHYLHVKTYSETFKHKPINKNFYRYLFRNETQINAFLQICQRLLQDKDLNLALNDVQNLTAFSRKKISLDNSAIEEADKKQLKLAETLGKYLWDDEEVIPVKAEASAPPQHARNESVADLLSLFKKKNFRLNKKEIDIVAQKNGIFPDSLIQQINEKYYEKLDDLLIEYEGTVYVLNETYYARIKNGNS